MAKAGLDQLMYVLTHDYGTLKVRLARRLGSPDFADEVLQEAYLRLQKMELPSIKHPRTYLFRVALNIAADRRRTESRRLARSEVELMLRLEYDELDPERVAEARSSIRLLVEAMEELPPRQRAILMAARFEGLPYAQIAARFGISTRYLERELKQALEYCRHRLEGGKPHKFGRPRSRTSKE